MEANMGKQLGHIEMGYRASVSAWPPAKGDVIQIHWLDYRWDGPHRMIQCGDIFPVFCGEPARQVANARVAAFHHEGNVDLEFGVASCWRIGEIESHPAFQIAPRAPVTLWKFEQPLP
jgi:hypothetical protein